MLSSERPVSNPMLVLREEFDDCALLFDPDTGKIIGLNQVGVFIWKRLDGTRTKEDIIKELATDFRKVPAEAGVHLGEFLQRLTDYGFVGYEINGEAE